jgi:hypothetical protein
MPVEEVGTGVGYLVFTLWYLPAERLEGEILEGEP